MSDHEIVTSFVVDDKLIRLEAMRAARVEALRLTRETGFDHNHKWDNELQRYDVLKAPIDVPTDPWDMKDNRPKRLDPIGKPVARFVPLSDLVVEAGSIPHTHWLTGREHATDGNAYRKTLQAALDAQYGAGHFWAYNHGSRIAIQCRYPLSGEI